MPSYLVIHVYADSRLKNNLVAKFVQVLLRFLPPFFSLSFCHTRVTVTVGTNANMLCLCVNLEMLTDYLNCLQKGELQLSLHTLHWRRKEKEFVQLTEASMRVPLISP